MIDLNELNRYAAQVLADSANDEGAHPLSGQECGPLAAMIEYTLLRADATVSSIDSLCDNASRFGFAAVCVNPCWVRRAIARLSGSSVRVVTVIGFPLGASITTVKAHEARQAVDAGAHELDVVAPIGHMIDEDWSYVMEDIGAVLNAASGRPVKVILETSALSPEVAVKAALVSRRVGADFVKTSTGFHDSGGATVAAVRLLRRAVGPDMGVKASGGIRDAQAARRLVAAGANRIGTSALLVEPCTATDERAGR